MTRVKKIAKKITKKIKMKILKKKIRYQIMYRNIHKVFPKVENKEIKCLYKNRTKNHFKKRCLKIFFDLFKNINSIIMLPNQMPDDDSQPSNLNSQQDPAPNIFENSVYKSWIR